MARRRRRRRRRQSRDTSIFDIMYAVGRVGRYGTYGRRYGYYMLPWNRRKWRRKLRPLRYLMPPVALGAATQFIPVINVELFTAIGAATVLTLIMAVAWESR